MIAALLQISARQWRAHRLRVTLTILGISLGVGAYFAISTANLALLDSLALTVERLAGQSTLEVSAGETGFPEAVLETVRGTAGVQVAEPVIEVITHSEFAEDGNLLILGVDIAGDQQLRQYQFDLRQSQLGDPLVFLAQPYSILLSESYAARHGLKAGDRLGVFTATGRQAFTVRGVFKPTGVGAVFGGNVAVMDVYAAQVVFNRGRNFDRIDLKNTVTSSIDELQQRLRQRLPAGLQVDRPQVRGRALESTVTAMRLGMLITSFLALLVGVYLIFNSFSIAVNQRWKEIGIVRALGVERGRIQALFLCEALAMGLIGSIVGIVGGYFAAILANTIMSSIAASVFGVVATAVPPTLHAALLWQATLLGIAASLLGAWFPARAASHLDPILALHDIEARQRETTLGWQRATLGALVILASALLVTYSPARAGMTAQLAYAGLLLLGLTIVMPVLVHWCARLLRPVLDRFGGAEGALAVDAMIQSPRRSAATVGALTISLMFVFATGAYIQSYRQMIDRWTDRLLNADLFVSTSALLRSTSYHFSEDLGRRIAALPEVKRAENVRFTMIPFRGDSAAVIAYEMDGFLARAAGAIMGGDESVVRRLLPSGQGVLVSTNFASRWNSRVGERITINAPTGVLDLPVVGIVEDYRSDKGSIFMDRALYKRYWRDDAVDFVDISLRPGMDATAAKRHIEQLTTGTEHALVYTNAEFRGWISSLVDQFFLLNDMQLAIAVIVAIVGIANTMAISAAERRREFGILRALGGLRSQIARLVMLEAVAISLIGVLAGAFAALFAIQFMSHTVSIVVAGYDVPYVFPWQLILASLPPILVVALLSAWLPARRATRIEVVGAIGYE
jgi:putative ABC transport system permease protein